MSQATILQPALCQGCQMAKFYPFLSLDCARVKGVGAQSKERKGSNFAIWQPWHKAGCKIVACDISQEWMDKAIGYWKEAGLGSVVEPMVGPAAESLDKLISQGEAGKFDFAFIDADKVGCMVNFCNFHLKLCSNLGKLLDLLRESAEADQEWRHHCFRQHNPEGRRRGPRED